MRVDPKRVMREYMQAFEKYKAYTKECKERGEEPLPFEAWNKREIDRAWIEGFKQAGCIIIDLGGTKIVTWPPEEKKKKTNDDQ
jgi:hypothetical protein